MTNYSSSYLKLQNSHPKPYLATFFRASLLSFKDLTFLFYIWILNTTIEGTMKKISKVTTFATTSGSLTLNYGLEDRSTFWSTLP
jgi:hypothetical protein